MIRALMPCRKLMPRSKAQKPNAMR